MRWLIDGGPFMWLLVFLSVLALTFVLERAWQLRRARVLPPGLLVALEDGDESRVRGACLASPSPLSRLTMSVLDHLRWSKAENVAALEVRARQEVANLERGLVILEIIVGIAPLLGLVGTIYGIIPLLGDFGKSVQADNAFLARGMSVALYKTVLGLLVAMPTLAAWSFFNKRVELLALELEGVCDATLRRHYLTDSGPDRAK
jgi:biopolymer transport protein ExbB